MKNIYKEVLRKNLDFKLTKGIVKVSDLWVLSLEALNELYKNYMEQTDKLNRISLLEAKTKEDADLELRIEIIKDIVNTRLEEKKLKEQTVLKMQQKAKYMELLDKKREKDLENLSEEDLLNKISDLEK